MPARDRVAAAIASLDPASRALLELSTRRGLSEEEIGDLLGTEPAEIRRRRLESVARLGAQLGVGAAHHYELEDQLSRLDDAEWRAEHPAAGPAPDTRRRRAPVVVGGVLLLVAAAVAVLVLGSGDGDRDGRSPDPGGEKSASRDGDEKAKNPKPQKARPGVTTGRVLAMERLNDTRGRGTAQIRRQGARAQVRLRATGFLRPRGGGYAVWLNSPGVAARRLYATDKTSIERDIPLPADVGRYRFLEVARAVPRLNSRHSGLSLLRVPIAELAKPR